MIVCFNCTAETKDDLDHLLSVGAYRDYGEAIAAAIRNQLLMEKEVGGKGAIVIGSPAVVPSALREAAEKQQPPETVESRKPTAPGPLQRPARKITPKAAANGRASLMTITKPPTIPALFHLDGFPDQTPAGLAELPGDMWAHGQVVPLDRWVLGQQNRLLPAKVNARALSRLFLENPKGLPIGPTAERIANQAALLGDYLSVLDEARGNSRDDALATAFPTTADEADKGRLRYANQFVAYQNSRGELSGLMVDLKLVNVALQRKERLIVPTSAAWEFARLPNPVLDGAPNGNAQKFTPEERSMLLRHIASSVPVEAFAYRTILEAVRDGHDSPDKIDAALRIYVAPDRAEKLTPSFLASQRSGAISRMSDLGLIERQREGVRVSYALTEDGRSFLTPQEAANETISNGSSTTSRT
jgi:hypothetical protein